MPSGGPNTVAMTGFVIFIGLSLAHHVVGGKAHPQHERLLCRRRIGHGAAERPRARRRLHERRQFPGHRRHGGPQWLRRPHLLHRLSRRVARGGLSDRGAAQKPWPLHVQRCGGVQIAAGARPRGGRRRQPGGGGVLSDRADGRRRQPDSIAVRPRLRDRRRHRRRGDAGVRALRRHDRHHLGSDRQSRVAAVGRVHARVHGVDAVLVQPARALQRRGE